MSELDLSQPLQPSVPATDGALVLAPPAPVLQVEPEQAVGLVAVPAEKRSELQRRSADFVAGLAAESPQSPEFTRKVDDVVRMGVEEIRSSAQVSNRLLERPSSSLAAARGRGPAGDPQARVAKTLTDLRSTIAELDPAKTELGGARRLLSHLPGASKVTRYFQRYQSAQKQLDAIITALASGQDELRRDNAAIEQERANLWATMGRLAEYETLARALDEALSAKVAELRASQSATADALTSDALFPIRQRRQDLMTQIAVSVQGYLALDLIRKNNTELIKGVERAQTTTVSALRTAVVVAQALGNQKLVLDQISALNDTTSAMIGRTGELLRQQSGQVQQQAVSSGVGVETLQRAFDDVMATIDAIDGYKAKAVESMAQTVSALEAQVSRAGEYLQRSHDADRGGVAPA